MTARIFHVYQCTPNYRRQQIGTYISVEGNDGQTMHLCAAPFPVPGRADKAISIWVVGNQFHAIASITSKCADQANWEVVHTYTHVADPPASHDSTAPAPAPAPESESDS
jgi:hypothetical protein